MKLPALLVLTAVIVFSEAASCSPVDDYDVLLSRYVRGDAVDYAAWKASEADLGKLEAYVGYVAEADLSGMGGAERLAFHLNAYNAWILHEILEKYPVKGPLSVSPFFFHFNRIKVAGKKMSFDHLEQDIIRPRFGEPRIHFALNCASVSCPPLDSEAFRAEGLGGQLERLAKAFINSPSGVVVRDGRVFVSKIFDWYGEDFEEAGGVLAYIGKYRDEPLPEGAGIEFMDYDWSLNDVR